MGHIQRRKIYGVETYMKQKNKDTYGDGIYIKRELTQNRNKYKIGERRFI